VCVPAEGLVVPVPEGEILMVSVTVKADKLDTRTNIIRLNGNPYLIAYFIMFSLYANIESDDHYIEL
jgi:hypothetical protein